MTTVNIILGGPGDLGFARSNLTTSLGLVTLRSTTWYWNEGRLRTWDHFPVVVSIEEKDLRVKKGVKGWAGWIPRSEDERSKFQELVLCSSEGRARTREDGDHGLAALQERLEEADSFAEQEQVNCPGRDQSPVRRK